MSGRLPIHVTQNNLVNDVASTSGMDLRMTTLPSMLKTAPVPYKTHMVCVRACAGARACDGCRRVVCLFNGRSVDWSIVVCVVRLSLCSLLSMWPVRWLSNQPTRY